MTNEDQIIAHLPGIDRTALQSKMWTNRNLI
ncbi:MAG: hypothetical protein ACI8U4_003154 [Natronomonas sp.]|jgi:hypothetical protein